MYSGVIDIIGRYWSAYGGVRALVRSPYLHFAIVLLALTFNAWLSSGWWDQSLSVLPNVLGFTLGGFAIFIGFGDERFRQVLAEPDEGGSSSSAYVQLCATFVHFIVVQVLALIAAVLAKAWWFYASWADPIREYLPYLNALGGALGYGLFLYALTSVLAAVMHVFRIASMYEQLQQAIKDDKG